MRDGKRVSGAVPHGYYRKPEDCQCTNYHDDPYTWNATTVGYILSRREYLGHTILGKTTKDSFKTKRKRVVNEDELLIFYNTHEAIIDQETYDKAQNQATKRVSQYVLNDEKEFVEQLKAQYEIQCEKDNSNEKKELLEAKRRMQYSILIYFISEKGLGNCF